ncbi:MAG: S1 RNA-binding domain-containing protein [Firmicutes bacterium]|nr:S1 RNA-binding domain-containing protein [Bacillota bacterium]
MSTDGARVLALSDIDQADLLGFIGQQTANRISVHEACDLYGIKIGFPGFEVERVYYLLLAEKGLEEEAQKAEKPAAGAGVWEKGDQVLKERILQNNLLPRSERKTISTILKEVAEETGKSFGSVQLRYYSVIKKQMDREHPAEPEETSEEMSLLTVEPSKTVEPAALPAFNLPQVGDVVNARISNIIDYGVFALAEEGYQGFIRLGEVTRDEWLYGRADLERYFHPGENVKVKVVSTTDNKVYFSCKAVGGKKPHSFNSANGNTLKVSKGSTIEKELLELVAMLGSRVGKVSERAREGLGELMITHGVVKVTARMFEIIDQLDQSAWVVREVKESLDNEFNRVCR